MGTQRHATPSRRHGPCPSLFAAMAARRSRAGFAILMVVLILVGLAMIAAPFAISMRQEEKTSIQFASRIHAKLAARAALNWSIAQLELSHEYYETLSAGDSATALNTPYFDSRGEFRVDFRDPALGALETSDPTGAMMGTSVQDEQGKINLKTASRMLLYNLFVQIFDSARAATLADAIVTWRDTQRHEFTSVAQLRDRAIGVTPAELDRLGVYLTVHSASLVGDVPPSAFTTYDRVALHAVNINTCSEEVLRAVLYGIRLRPPQAGDVDAAGNPIAPHLGVGAYTASVTVDNVSYTENSQAFTTLIARLHVFGTLASDAAPGAASIDVDGLNVSDLPLSGWISIDGDAVRFERTDDSGVLNVAPPANTPAGEINEAHEAGARVRLLITDIETDLAGITGRMVDEQTLTPDSRSAILVNAIDPQDEDVLDRDSADNSRMASTAPFCFRSFNIYTIEAHGIVNAPDGSELARYTVREVAQVAPASELQIRIETQEDFQRSLASGRSHHVATWPNACQVSDIPPQNTEDSDNLALRGRLGPAPAEYSPAQTPTFMARFNGPLMRNTLRAEIAAAGLADPHAFTDSAFPRTVKAEPGDDGDIEPEGIHIGARGSDPETKRVLAYPARLDIEVDGATTTLSNIPHDRDYVDPFVLEMWVKFDSDFDYAEDHFLFDLAEATYTNRVALYYDSTDTAEKRGDLVLHVCDATEAPPLPAQVRFPVTSDTFEPERWYHVAVVVKGLGYNQMALFIDGKSRGHYEPSGALEGNVTADALSIDCGELAWYNDSKIFAPFTWPAENTVVINGELVEHSNATARNLAVRADGRGARGTQARAHYAGARVELYGYDERVVQSRDHVGHPMTIMSRDADSPMLDGALPADMPHDIEVDDGDEDNPDGATAPTTTTADESTDYFDPDPDTDPLTAAYQAATDVNADYAIPTGDWLPIAVSEKWIEEAKGDPLTVTLADDSTRFDEVLGTAADPTTGLQRMLAWTTQRPTVAAPIIDGSAEGGLGFFRVTANPDGDDTGEFVKYAKAGIALVWRYHPDDVAAGSADPPLPQEQWRKIAWYIGYLADLGGEDVDGNPTGNGQRACFETTKVDIVEGAKIKLDCVKLVQDGKLWNLPRGHQEEITWTYTQFGEPDDIQRISKLNGQGIFQLYTAIDAYEWVQFTYPQWTALPGNPDAATEIALVDSRWLVGISRNSGGTTARDWAPGTPLMPVFFGTSVMSYNDNNNTPVRKGKGDTVTLTDLTHQRETRTLSHGSGHYFAFRQHVVQAFEYGNYPRILKFPSGSLPMKPDLLMYLGSDGVCQDGDETDRFEEDFGDESAITTPAEPERPANATFDEIKIYRAGNTGTSSVYDWEATAAPQNDKSGRWKQFAIDADAPPIPNALAPPFYVRVGRLERLSPKVKQPDDPAAPPNFEPPFRFVQNGHTSWPVEGYLKIDDECMYYRTMYYNRKGSRSADILIHGTAKDENGLYIVLSDSGSSVYVDYEQGKNFPDKGYITISNSYPSKSYADRFVALGTGGVDPPDPAMMTQFLDWLNLNNNAIRSDGGGTMSNTGYIGNQERLFYDEKEKTTVDGEPAWRLNLAVANRGILDSSPRVVRVLNPDDKPSWYTAIEGYTQEDGSSYVSAGHASVHVFPCELLILKRGCLGTGDDTQTPLQKTNHAVGTIVMPLEHIPTSLTPRPFVKLKRDVETGRLQRDPDSNNVILALADDDADFDVTLPEYEYGIVLEDADWFPDEGCVQIGDEIIGYVQERSDPSNEDSNRIWTAKVPSSSHPEGFDEVTVLTGVTLFRQRYGTARSAYLEPADASPLRTVPVSVPVDTGDAGAPETTDVAVAEPEYWNDHEKHIVRFRDFRYHDRYPLKPDGPVAAGDKTDGYFPHYEDSDLGYYEFAVTLPGALWTRVEWDETAWRLRGTDWELDDDGMLDSDNPCDVKVLVQIDGAPGWDDMTADEAVKLSGTSQPVQPVAAPVYWEDVANRSDVYDDDAGSHRPKKPVLYLFDYHDDHTARNYINPYKSSGSLAERGQYGDRIRLRVYFHYRPGSRTLETGEDTHDIPWRTPWVDTIRLYYKAPTFVMEHREMAY